MTPKQQDRLALYREFGNKAAEAYDFIFAEDVAASLEETTDSADGVYYVYGDKSTELYTGQAPSREVEYIGIKQGNRSVAVALNGTEGGDEYGEFTLFSRDVDLPSNSNLYTSQKGINAPEDFDGEANTEFILEKGSPIPVKDGEHIPSAGEAMLISSYLSKVNEALRKAGGQPLSGWHWTSTLHSSTGAWYVNFSNGYLDNYGNNKYNTNSVRAVAALF